MVNWIRSSVCEGGGCVEVAFDPTSESEAVGIRMSQMPSETLWFTTEEWNAFVEGVKAGEFNL